MGSVQYHKDPEHPYYQVKRCTGQSHAFRKHTHPDLVIALITGGSSLFRFGDDAHHLHVGQLVLIGPGFVHQCCPEQVEAWSFWLVSVSERWLEERGISGPSRPCFVVRDTEEAERQTLFRQYESLCRPGEDREEALLFLLDAALGDSGDTVLRVEEPGYEAEAFRLAERYIREHLTENIPLEKLARLAGVDKYALIRGFRRGCNATPHALQTMLRVNEGRRLLEAGVPPAEAALEAGFYDQSHFTRCFKDSFGVTPLRFLKGAQ